MNNQSPNRVSGPCRAPGLIVAEFRVEAPITFTELQAMERSCACCLHAHGVEFAGVIIERGGMRGRLLLRSPDIESVRQVVRHMPIRIERIFSDDE